jgi:hypothetical protein
MIRAFAIVQLKFTKYKPPNVYGSEEIRMFIMSKKVQYSEVLISTFCNVDRYNDAFL